MYTHTYINIYIYIHMFSCLWYSTVYCMMGHIHTYIHTYMHIYIYICMHIYIYIHTYILIYVHTCVYIYIYIYIYGRFPRPASTKNTQVYTCCVRVETNIPYQSKKKRGYMNKTYPTRRQESILCFLGPLRGMIRGYASGSVEG